MLNKVYKRTKGYLFDSDIAKNCYKHKISEQKELLKELEGSDLFTPAQTFTTYRLLRTLIHDTPDCSAKQFEY